MDFIEVDFSERMNIIGYSINTSDKKCIHLEKSENFKNINLYSKKYQVYLGQLKEVQEAQLERLNNTFFELFYQQYFSLKKVNTERLRDIVPNPVTGNLDVDVTSRTKYPNSKKLGKEVHGTLSFKPEGEMYLLEKVKLNVNDLYSSSFAMTGSTTYQRLFFQGDFLEKTYTKDGFELTKEPENFKTLRLDCNTAFEPLMAIRVSKEYIQAFFTYEQIGEELFISPDNKKFESIFDITEKLDDPYRKYNYMISKKKLAEYMMPENYIMDTVAKLKSIMYQKNRPKIKIRTNVQTELNTSYKSYDDSIEGKGKTIYKDLNLRDFLTICNSSPTYNEFVDRVINRIDKA